MGYILALKCKHCGYTYSTGAGFGMRVNVTQKKVEADVRRGKYGELIQMFLQEYPLGTINTYETIAECPTCHEFRDVYDLTMYIPRKWDKDFWQFADAKYAENPLLGKAPRDFDYYDRTFHDQLNLDVFYEKYMDNEHYCPACGSLMRLIPYIDHYVFEEQCRDKLKCPKCGNPIGVHAIGWWD